MTVTHEMLSCGIVLAMQNAARFLADAISLLKVGAVPSCQMLTIFGLEELGRVGILRQSLKTLAEGETVDTSQLQSQLADHLAKLRLGRGGTFARLSPAQTETYLKAIKTGNVEAEKLIRGALDKSPQRQRNDGSTNLHQKRFAAQYVDLHDDGTWSDPSQVTIDAATTVLDEVVAEFANAIISNTADLGSASAALMQRAFQLVNDLAAAKT